MFAQQSRQRRKEEMLLDASLTMLTFLAAYWMRSAFIELRPLPHIALLPVIVPLWAFLLVFFHAYRNAAEASAAQLVLAPLRAVGAGLVLLFTLTFLLRAHDVSRATLISFGILDSIALLAARVIRIAAFRRALRRGEGHRRVLIVGSGNRAERLARALCQKPQWGTDIIGFLDPDVTAVGRTIAGAKVLGTLDEVSAVLRDQVVDEVALAIPRGMIGAVEKVVRACEEEGVKVRLMADLYEINAARVSLDEVGDLPLLTFEPVAYEEWKLLVKRGMDIGLTLLAMPFVLPAMAVIALAIRLDSGGPALFRQMRVGLSKRRFMLFKFRTMRNGAEQLQTELEHLNEVEGPVFKIKNDPRVTRVGRFLRRASLDELPQLFNVLRGEMSLVGPRPLPLRDVDRFDRGVQRKRFSVKPGITGLWQVSGRSDVSFSEWVRLDLLYIDNWALSLDLTILMRTIPVALKGTGAS